MYKTLFLSLFILSGFFSLGQNTHSYADLLIKPIYLESSSAGLSPEMAESLLAQNKELVQVRDSIHERWVLLESQTNKTPAQVSQHAYYQEVLTMCNQMIQTNNHLLQGKANAHEFTMSK